MAKKKTSVARIVIPLSILAVGIVIAVVSTMGRGGSQAPAKTESTDQAAVAQGEGAPDALAEQPSPIEQAAREPVEAASEEPTPAAEAGAFVARVSASPFQPVVIGSLDATSGYVLEAAISPFGIGIETLKLTEYFEDVQKTEHITAQHEAAVDTGVVSVAVPYALTALMVDGVRVDLTSGPKGEPVWRVVSIAADSASFEALIDDASGAAAVRVVRVMSVSPNSHDLSIVQRAENLTGRRMSIQWVHTGPIGFDSETGGYGGDKRRLRFGYWLDPKAQAGDPSVLSDRFAIDYASMIGVEKRNGVQTIPVTKELWPSPASVKDGLRLVWVGMTGRYFGVSLHPLIDASSTDKTFKVSSVRRVAGLEPGMPGGLSKQELLARSVAVLLVESVPMQVAAGESASFDLGVYAGPLSRAKIRQEAVAQQMGLDGMVLYNFGGPCAVCTFQWLARLLLDVLQFVHGLTGDWGLAIILLVVIVRTCLHPVTKWSQIRLQKFGVQMQAIAPKQQKLREKYKDDPKKMQQEMTKLWKEEGINPAGMLGCLPMFLQTPVWIALYATLFFAVELRHQPAFYGVFQQMGGWQFLADLSRSDNAIALGKSFNVFGLMQIDAINVLPLLLGLVFYFHQKFLTPPTTATLTPEQESTQKMVKVMMVVMFPLFMYAAPSGLALYFITNSVLAIGESKWIRAHMNKHGLLDADKIREAAKAKKRTGLLAKLQQMAEAQQQQQQASNRMMKRVRNVAPPREDPKFKRRK